MKYVTLLYVPGYLFPDLGRGKKMEILKKAKKRTSNAGKNNTNVALRTKLGGSASATILLLV